MQHCLQQQRFCAIDGGKGGAQTPEWKNTPEASHFILPSNHNGQTFPSPVQIQWISLDGKAHEATLDLDTLYKDRLVLHQVPRDQVPDAWLASWATSPLPVDIMVVVDDRTIDVYMRAGVVACDPQDPGNIDKRRMRFDLMLAWSRTYQ